MWENLTSHEIRGVFVFTYCHVDGEPIWDGSRPMPGAAVTSSCRSRDISRGKHWVQRKSIKTGGIFLWMFGDISASPKGSLSHRSGPRCGLWAVVQRATLALTRPGTRATVLVPGNHGLPLWGNELFIRTGPSRAVIAGRWFVLISRGERFRWVLRVTHPFFKTLVSSNSHCCLLSLGLVSDRWKYTCHSHC